MAKKKKKNAPKTKVIKTVKFDDVCCESILMQPFVILNPDEHNPKSIICSAMLPSLNEFNRSDNVLDMINKSNKTTEIFKTLQSTIKATIHCYLDMHEMDQNLNLYNDNSAINTAEADIINMYEYFDNSLDEQDILKSAIMALNNNMPEPDDLSLLWSTNEYVGIWHTPSLGFALKRMGYDRENKCIDYMIVIYCKRLLDEDVPTTIPTTIATISVDFVNIENESQFSDATSPATIDHNADVLSWYAIKNMNCVLDQNSTNYRICPRIKIKKISNELTLARFISKLKHAVKAFPDKDKITTDLNIVSSAIHFLICEMADLAQDSTPAEFDNHIIRKLYQNISTAIAIIVLTNVALKTQKLSAPDKPESKADVSHVEAPDDKKVLTDTRRVRHIGGITLTSERRPTAPTMKKIIQYTMSEWGRRGFVRHYKSGKTVYIEPTTVHRRCIDMKTKKTASKKSTEYIVHADMLV